MAASSTESSNVQGANVFVLPQGNISPGWYPPTPTPTPPSCHNAGFCPGHKPQSQITHPTLDSEEDVKPLDLSKNKLCKDNPSHTFDYKENEGADPSASSQYMTQSLFHRDMSDNQGHLDDSACNKPHYPNCAHSQTNSDSLINSIPVNDPDVNDSCINTHIVRNESTNSYDSITYESISHSAEGDFGWTVIDNISLPYIVRDGHQYASVRMAELKLLSKFPNSFPEDLAARAPLVSHCITQSEADLLNRINTDLCNDAYGKQVFNEMDLIVKFTDLMEFYYAVKEYYPDEVLQTMPKPRPPNHDCNGGWMQINNTVVPYLYKYNAKFVPLSVVRYAAGLLTEVPVEGVLPLEEECAFLNDICDVAGLDFYFESTTKLVSVDLIMTMSLEAVTIQDLPKHNPFS